MAEEVEPVVGNWYRHLDKGQKFEVVAADEEAGWVEIQHFDGDIEEVELDAWYDMAIEPAEPPEDWTGPIDDVEEDDLGYTETDMSREDWRGSLNEFRSEAGFQEIEPGVSEEEE